MHAIRRELRGSAIALAMVAATTLVAYMLIKWFDVRRGSVIYLLPVLLAGWHLGLVPALVAAVAGVLWSGYLFFSPYYSFYLAQPKEILNLLLFMVVAVVTSHLANSMKTQTEIARKREGEMSNLYAFSRRLASSSSAADIYLAIEEHLASLVQRKVVLFGVGAAGDPHSAVARKSRLAGDCVVVDASPIEPVSTSNSLLRGKRTGNFSKLGLMKRFLREFAAQNQYVVAKFPMQWIRELI